MPGTYKVSLSQFVDGVYTELVPPQSFKCVPLSNATLATPDKKGYDDFCKKITEIRRVSGAVGYQFNDLNNRIRLIKLAVVDAPKVGLETHNQIFQLEKRLEKVSRQLNGDATLARREFETPPSVNSRIFGIQGDMWTSTSAPSGSQKASLEAAYKELTGVITELKNVQNDLKNIESALDKAGAPYTPGRAIEWKN